MALPSSQATVDPTTAEIIRHGLNSAAEQMKRALIRTAYSPVIYEVVDFAVAIYDREVRLLAQAIGMPHFMGRLSFGIEAAVAAVGGEDALAPGDILYCNVPYSTGAHANDAAMLMPVFWSDGDLLGYTAITAHWLDVGGKDPYSTNTVDVFQEGTLFPGVKVYAAGVLSSDIYRTMLANSRVPKMIEGDLNAEVVGLRTGAQAFSRIAERHGRDLFGRAVERMFDHGEATIRSFLERIPDGEYVGEAILDSDGITDEPVPFEIVVEVAGSSIVVDYSRAPDALAGPLNCPYPATVSSTRVALMMLAGGGDAPNEGHFRPISVRTRPGSMFHPLSPAPCFLYPWPFFQGSEAIYNAIGRADPTLAPAWSAGDILSLVWWGNREASGEPWADGSPYPIGHGGHHGGDGANALMHDLQSGTRFSPVEVSEARNPWWVERVELVPDSCGAGRHRGGLGVRFSFVLLEEAFVTPVIERTKNPPLPLAGGAPARPNSAWVIDPDGTRTPISKATRVRLPAGARLELSSGGGAGFGDPAEREPELVRRDLREGYVTLEHAREWYPHAL